MTDAQAQYLGDLLEEYPVTEWTIRSIEFPAGITAYSGTTAEKLYHDTIKVVYSMREDPNRIYIDYIGNEGFVLHTESRRLEAV